MMMNYSPLILLGSLGLAFALSGEATFYGGNIAGGTCSFTNYNLPDGIYGTALSDSNWDDALHCGQCLSVTYQGGSPITVMVVDECPGCGQNHVDLFPDAFSALAPSYLGVINVDWEYIECPITSPLQLHNKDGVSPYWFAMQVVNSNKAVESLEVSTDGGNSWQSTTRQFYNFFENASGFRTSTVDVKVISIDGDVVIVEAVSVSPDTRFTASSNFGSSSPTAAKANVAPSPSSTQSSSTTGSPSTAPSSYPIYQSVASSSYTSTPIYQLAAAPSDGSTPIYQLAVAPSDTSTPSINQLAAASSDTTTSSINHLAATPSDACTPRTAYSPTISSISVASSTATIPPYQSFTTRHAHKKTDSPHYSESSSTPPVSTTTVTTTVYVC